MTPSTSPPRTYARTIYGGVARGVIPPMLAAAVPDVAVPRGRRDCPLANSSARVSMIRNFPVPPPPPTDWHRLRCPPFTALYTAPPCRVQFSSGRPCTRWPGSSHTAGAVLPLSRHALLLRFNRPLVVPPRDLSSIPTDSGGQLSLAKVDSMLNQNWLPPRHLNVSIQNNSVVLIWLSKPMT